MTALSFDFSENLQCCRLHFFRTIGDSEHDQQSCQEISFVVDNGHQISDFNQEEIEKLYNESLDVPLAKDSF